MGLNAPNTTAVPPCHLFTNSAISYTSLTEKVGDLKKAKDSGNADDIKTAMESLNNAWSQIASKMYDSTKESEGSSPGEGQTTEKNKKEGEIEDADFEVVD